MSDNQQHDQQDRTLKDGFYGVWEDRRQLLHVSMVIFALLLRYLNWWQSALCALVALLHNLFILPHTGKSFFRSGESQKLGGMVIYPITVLLLILMFRGRLYLAAGCWAILSFGDGFATIVGRRIGKHRWPWNRAKSVEGSLAYWVSASLGAIGIGYWVYLGQAHGTDSSFGIVMLAFLFGSLIASVVETLPIPIDDNLTAPLAAGCAIAFFL